MFITELRKVEISPMISSRNGWIAIFDSNPFYIKKKRNGKVSKCQISPPSMKIWRPLKRLALPEWQIVCIWRFDNGGATAESASLLPIGPRGFGTVPFWRDRTSSTESKGRKWYFVKFRVVLLISVQRWFLYLIPLSNVWWHCAHSLIATAAWPLLACLLKFLIFWLSLVSWWAFW